jgi:hypothetical protein
MDDPELAENCPLRLETRTKIIARSVTQTSDEGCWKKFMLILAPVGAFPSSR